jgi:dihydroorotate dehydrogenase (NAD+) catalytic subunit
VKAKKRVVTGKATRPPGTKRRPTVRRIRPTIAPVPRRRGPPPPTPPASARTAEPEPVDAAPIDIAVDLGRGLRLGSPVMAAAGCYGYGIEIGPSAELGALGAIVTRSTTPRARAGNRPPRALETTGGLINAVGLQNPGVDAIERRHTALWAQRDVPVLVSVAGGSVGDFVEVVRRLEGLPGIAGWELNLSCPNSARSGTIFALEPDAAAGVVAAVRRATELAVVAKLSPAAPDPRVIARAVEDAGADAIAAVNTLPVLAVGGEPARPLLGSPYGGLSGPALKPLALRIVREVAQVAGVPVIGVGGIAGLDDVLEFLAVGASAVQLGTALLADPLLATRIAEDLATECRRRGLASHRELVGGGLPARRDPPSARGAEYRP